MKSLEFEESRHPRRRRLRRAESDSRGRRYLKAHGATVSAFFYLSNVEQYLEQDNKWQLFCGNVASLPLDMSSTFIRSTNRGRGFGPFGPGFVSRLGAMAEETKNCGA